MEAPTPPLSPRSATYNELYVRRSTQRGEGDELPGLLLVMKGDTVTMEDISLEGDVSDEVTKKVKKLNESKATAGQLAVILSKLKEIGRTLGSLKPLTPSCHSNRLRYRPE